MTTRVVDRPTMQIRTHDVSGAVHRAMDGAVSALGHSRAEMERAIGKGDCQTCDRLRFRLSQELGAYLGSVDSSVRAVYLYEPDYATSSEVDVSERPGLSAGMSMLVLAERQSAGRVGD